ncbi:neuropeptide-like 1 isoform X1 [Diabrotica virgifera virgifera]|uniref:Neuropeptide-like 1 isoform X1 n=1 Tax=Diabrotica virgifera virgifera TaxID=50390 RepID=A0A6P7F734_DIAVI|nr:neuropeptide-like 1 isoform X1 [Diabrotica virgifera virgifera]
MSKYLALNFVFGVVVFFIGICKVLSIDLDDSQMLEELLNPQESQSIQVRALRRELLKKVQEALERLEDEEEYQRANEALSRWNAIPEQKRNLQSLARAGYIKTLPDEEDDSNYKRSIANLAKNGQLPKRPDEQKRGIESLARNGDLRLRRELQGLLENLNDKRHIGSLARSYDLPFNGKRSLSSLAKSGDLLKHAQYKRSPNSQETVEAGASNTISKQSPDNLQPLSEDKGAPSGESKRGKREAADYYYENGNENYSPVYQNTYDYDDLIQDLHDAYPEVGKRFLGSVAKSGWFRPSSSISSKYMTPEKRHIGALARLGWLPSFRHIRRFNRSGRSTSSDDTCRETSSDGETEVNSNSEDPSLLLASNRRIIYQTPSENNFVRRVFYHPLTTKY